MPLYIHYECSKGKFEFLHEMLVALTAPRPSNFAISLAYLIVMGNSNKWHDWVAPIKMSDVAWCDFLRLGADTEIIWPLR